MKKILLLLLCVPLLFSCGEKEEKDTKIKKLEDEIEKLNDNIAELKKEKIKSQEQIYDYESDKKQKNIAVVENDDSYYEIKDYEEGKKIFEGGCNACHTIGRGKLIGQDLKGVLDRMSAEDFINFTQNPASKGVTAMPPQYLSADEIKSILEYITNYVEEEGSGPAEDEEW
ncbi:cytochrome c [Flavobacteriales bacterium]|nr:cytochrome c [Flavobacteriales bacterium]